MLSLRERLAMMEANPRRRNRGQVPRDVVAAALQYQREFVHCELEFNTGAISDCAESLEKMRADKREARESREMMWEDHFATVVNNELVRASAARAKKLAQETATLSQLSSERDKWNMAIELHMLEFLRSALKSVGAERRKEYLGSCQKSGQTPLHRACKANDAQLVQLLLSLGAELTTVDEAQKTVFHVMAENRLTALFQAAVAQLPDTSQDLLLSLDSAGNSILHGAASSGADEILNQLLSDPYRCRMAPLVDLQRDSDQSTALHLAAENGRLRCLELLIVQGRANTTLSNVHGSNVLHLVAQQTFNVEKLADAVLKLTPHEEKDTTFNSFDESSGQCCLHTAIAKGFLGFSDQLINDKVVQLNTSTREGGWSPLHLAAMIGSLQLVTALVEAGAIVDMVDADGQTPLLLACLVGQLEIVRLLLEKRANPAHQNKQAHSALHYLAAFCRERQLLEDLVGAGADVNAKSLKLNTPLHFAAMNGNEVATQVLLAHGASPSVINEDKRSVIYLAKKWHHRGVEDLVKPPEQTVSTDGSSGTTRGSNTATTRGNQRPITPGGFRRHLPGSRSSSSPTHAKDAKRLGFDDDLSDADSLFAFEDDEPILPPSHPWPIADGVGDARGRSATCRSFAELRESSTSIGETRLQLIHTTRRFLPDPVQVPWEMTMPVVSPGSGSASAQRKLKPSVRTNLGLLRDHLAHAQALYWPEQAARPPVREISALRW